VVRAATVAMKRRGKHTYTPEEGLCFMRGPCRGVILKAVGATVSVAAYSPDSNDLNTEAGERSSLIFVTRERVVKTL
jgi:hypothetical protein